MCLRITNKTRDLSNRVYASDEARLTAIEKAEKVESSLGSDHPSFVRSMLPSHVSGGFWLVSINSYVPLQDCFLFLSNWLKIPWMVFNLIFFLHYAGTFVSFLQEGTPKKRWRNNVGGRGRRAVAGDISGSEIWTQRWVEEVCSRSRLGRWRRFGFPADSTNRLQGSHKIVW